MVFPELHVTGLKGNNWPHTTVGR
uniref:Uncharacterized protein n=1 Tax=Arundo donax TaxID=35708 RepID=A0A0A9ANW0_ARUDO